jgi:urease accessory protein
MRPAPNPSPFSRFRTVAAAAAGAAAAGLLIAEPVGAHTGLPAGGALDGIVHPFLGVDHLLAMVAVGVLAALAKDRRVAWLTPIGFVAGMLGGGVLGLVGVEVSAVELAIAVSVVALGVLIITATDNSALWLPVLAAAFGAAHGHAHGAELPAGAIPFLYVAGFVTATVALHVGGTAVGLGLRRLPSVRVAAGALVSTAGVMLLLAG